MLIENKQFTSIEDVDIKTPEISPVLLVVTSDASAEYEYRSEIFLQLEANRDANLPSREGIK